jgi:hypothetical protein
MLSGYSTDLYSQDTGQYSAHRIQGSIVLSGVQGSEVLSGYRAV